LYTDLHAIKTKITLKFGNFSDEQGFQNNFNCKYLYNSKMVVKFLTTFGGPAAGLLSLIEVPEKAIVPFMVNAFDYVTFIHRLT
jgi:hypothetical protein